MVGMARKKENSAAARLSLPEQHGADDRGARPRYAGDQRQRLEQADAEADAERVGHDVGVPRGHRQPVDEEQHDATEDQHDRDQRHRFEHHARDEVVEQDAEDRRRKEGDDDAEGEAARRRARWEASIGEAPEPAGIDREQRQDRAELDQHLEGLAVVLEAKELADEEEMRGRGNGQEFGDALDDAKDQGVE